MDTRTYEDRVLAIEDQAERLLQLCKGRRVVDSVGATILVLLGLLDETERDCANDDQYEEWFGQMRPIRAALAAFRDSLAFAISDEERSEYGPHA